MKRNTKRIPALLLCLCLCLALLPAGGARAVTLQGVGTAEDPYLIGTAEELFAFADIVNGTNGAKENAAACARLTADVDLTGKAWVPMGDSGSRYNGTFEGDGFSVKGMTVDITATAWCSTWPSPVPSRPPSRGRPPKSTQDASPAAASARSPPAAPTAR